MTTEKVFISYSWSNPAHEQWVIDLATRLRGDGVDVILDKWDLKEGHDKYAFMERMVTASDVSKVLIVLDKKYTEKANGRAGGVGTETMIITPEVYQSATQEKFIPVIAETDDEGKPYLPAYLGSRIYIDLSLDDHLEKEYEKLLRSIFNRPSLVKPKLGSPPRYLQEDSPITFKTTVLATKFDDQIERNPGRINSLAQDFYDEFYINLKAFKISDPQDNYSAWGQLVVNNINQFTPLRDDYILFTTKLSKNTNGFDTDILIGFFEKLTSLLYPEEGVRSWRESQFDNYKFILHELFLYTVGIALNKENYKLLEEILHSSYFVQNRFKHNTDPERFEVFYLSIDSIDVYYKQLNNGKDLLSPQADLLMKRIPEEFGYTRHTLTNADLLCHYIARLHGLHWFPKTYIYRDEYSNSFPFLNKLISKKHVEKVKGVIGVNTVNELKEKMSGLQGGERRGYNRSWSYIPEINNWVKIDDIGTVR